MASRESEALPSLPFVFLLGWVYFYDFFSHLSFFWPFFFSFFLPVCMCLCVLSFRLGVGGVFLLALTFHRKHGPGAGCVTPTPGRRSKAWEEIFLIPDTRTVQVAGWLGHKPVRRDL